MRIVALDHGTVRTGVAISDETGTLARPLAVVEKVDTETGFATLLDLLTEHAPGRIVVGLPLSLDGREHAQAGRARGFAARLGAAVTVPVDLYDERFTSKLADQRGGQACPREGAIPPLCDIVQAQDDGSQTAADRHEELSPAQKEDAGAAQRYQRREKARAVNHLAQPERKKDSDRCRRPEQVAPLRLKERKVIE